MTKVVDSHVVVNDGDLRVEHISDQSSVVSGGAHISLMLHCLHIRLTFLLILSRFLSQLCCAAPVLRKMGKLGSDNKIQTKIGSAANKHLRNGWPCLSGSNYFCWARVLSKSARVVV